MKNFLFGKTITLDVVSATALEILFLIYPREKKWAKISNSPKS